AALATLPGLDSDRIGLAAFEVDRAREDRRRVAHAPFLDHRLVVDIDAVAVLGREAEREAPAFGRLDEAGPADRRLAPGAAPLDVRPLFDRGLRRCAFEIAVGEMLRGEALLRAGGIDAQDRRIDRHFGRADEAGALHVIDLAIGKARLDPVEHRHRVAGRAV